jgi:putative ABC transport system permease protein
MATGTRVAVIGQTVYRELFPDGESPLGATIRINNVSFRVIGLLEEKGGSGFNDQDNVVLIPLSAAQQRLFPARRADGKLRVNLIYAQVLTNPVRKRLSARFNWYCAKNMAYRSPTRMILLYSARRNWSAPLVR